MGLLWFRRSKAKETQPAAEPIAEMPLAAPAQPRLPVRLRGLLLLNLAPTDGLEQIETAPPLGPRDEVIAALQHIAPGLAFDASGRGELIEADHRLTVDVGARDQVHAAVAAAEGDAAIELLRTVLERQGWRAYAARAGVFVEPGALDLFGLSDDVLPTHRA